MKGEIKMKKILFAIAIVLTIGLTANAQSKNDAFVTEWGSSTRTWGDDALGLLIPTGAIGGSNDDQPLPLGSGLLVLTALGAGYTVARKRKK